MIDTVSLKASLIDLAVSGRLSTEFQAEDSINGIIRNLPAPSNKRKKLLGQTFDYGKQIDIPNNWRWMLLGEISSYGDTPVKANSATVSDNTWILDLEDIKSGGELITKTRANEKQFVGEKTAFKSGQVLYSKLRPYLKKVLVADEDGISTPELISFDVFGGILPQYVVYCLLDSFTNRAIDKRSYGIKMPRIDVAFMVNLPVPVPPVSEQQYIIERLEKAFTLIDTVDSLQGEYDSNQKALKRKLIDAAIQGKLTEQLPKDGTAEELFERITEEKRELVKEKKIKNEKALPAISENEIPFEIPNNWKWVRLSDISYRIWAGGDKPGDFSEESDDVRRVPVVANGVSNDGILGYTSKATATKNTITVAGRGTIGFTVLRKYDYCPIVRLIVIEQSQFIEPRYLQIFLQSMPEASVGSSIPQLTVPMIKPKLVPLPPLNEQIRISERLSGLLEALSESNQ